MTAFLTPLPEDQREYPPGGTVVGRICGTRLMDMVNLLFRVALGFALRW